MKIYELLRIPSQITNKPEEVESIDHFTDLPNVMYRVENDLLSEHARILWEFDEWGNLEAYYLVESGKEDGASDCDTHVYIVKYAGYMIKIIDVIN